MCALEKYDTRPTAENRSNQLEKPGSGRDRAGDDRVGAAPWQVLDTAVNDFDIERQGLGNGLEEGAFLGGTIDEFYRYNPQNRQNDTG